MQPQFQPPKDEAEFKERAKEISISAARSMLGALRQRRREATEKLDTEIKFYEKVIKSKF